MKKIWLCLALVIAGCGVQEARQSQGQSVAALTGEFVAIPRDFTANEQSAIRQQELSTSTSDGTFYIAIRRSELGKRYFLSVYLKQLFPMFTPPAMTLGTKVVSFQEQNGRVYVFDVDDRKASSSTYDPTVVLEAFDEVPSYAAFTAMPNSSQYVLFDPSTGLNRFSAVSQALSGSPGTGGKFNNDLLFSQRFRTLADGVQYDQVFAGHFDEPFPYNDGSIEQSVFSMSGTVSIALRKYTEGSGFTSFPFPDAPYFFASERLVIPNTGLVQDYAARWNIKPGMAPIKWTLSSRLAALQADPRYAKYDLVKAFQNGITGWNKVFGFTALTASVGGPGVEAGDDDKNVLVIDEDPSWGFAFANWRTNPNSGEIRGASVYFNAMWLDYAKSLFDPEALTATEATATSAAVQRTQAARLPALTWNGIGLAQDLRRMGTGTELELFQARMAKAKAANPTALPTEKELVERFLTHVVLHEVGHTLGLRHNFEGSLAPPSSSVMEYVDDFDAPFVPVPQAYDVDAVKYLYGMSAAPPTQQFCTDEDIGVTTPKCKPYDVGADPLSEYFAYAYSYYLQRYLIGRSDSTSGLNYYLAGVLDYVRAGDTASDRARAWEFAMEYVRPDIDPAVLGAYPSYGARADKVSRAIWSQLFLGAVNTYSDFVTAPPNDLTLRATMHGQLGSEVLNSDKVRTGPSSRQAIDVLKKLQTLEAYRALVDAKAALGARRAQATGDDALLLDDLIARAEVAMSPYFLK